MSVSQKECFICNIECSEVANCDKFLCMDLDDRWTNIKELRLCFCCLKPNHQIKSCYSKQMCGINGCPQKHHELLHNERRELSPAATD